MVRYAPELSPRSARAPRAPRFFPSPFDLNLTLCDSPKVQDVRAPPAAVRVVAARRFLRPLSVATVSYAGLGARTRKPRKRGRTARSEAVQSAGEHEPAAKRELKPSTKALEAVPGAATTGAAAKKVRASERCRASPRLSGLSKLSAPLALPLPPSPTPRPRARTRRQAPRHAECAAETRAARAGGAAWPRAVLKLRDSCEDARLSGSIRVSASSRCFRAGHISRASEDGRIAAGTGTAPMAAAPTTTARTAPR